MIKGVEILLERMSTHPEEFFGGSLKWQWIFGETWKEFLTAEEREALQTELDEIRKKEFTAKVMETLLREETSPLDSYIYQGQGALAAGQVLTGAVSSQSTTTRINRAQLEIAKRFAAAKGASS